jgi:hypothetical protein
MVSLATPKVFAANVLYLYGGAGDESHTENIFADEFLQQNRAAQTAGWQTSVLFDGDQPKAKARVARALGDPGLRSFSQENFKAGLQEVGEKKFVAGDQVLFIIDTHGEIDASVNGHGIACSKDKDCDTGDLKKTIQKLQSQGVRVAVVDESCYSGQSLKLADSKTCVISAASKDDIGTSSFPERFIKHFARGKNLEQVYLETYAENKESRPRISTDAGLEAERIIHSLAPESVEDVDVNHLKGVQRVCTDRSDDQIKQILHLSSALMRTSAADLTAAKKYIAATADYQKIYESVLETSAKLNPYREKTASIAGKDSAQYSWLEIAETENSFEDNKAFYEKKRELEKTNADFRHLESLLQTFQRQTADEDDTVSPLARAAQRARRYENELYLDLYKRHSGDEENPCATFTL